MPKGILEFDLVTEKVEFELASKAGNMHAVLNSMHEEIRKNLKYNDKLSAQKRKAYEEMSKFLWKELEEEGLNHLL